MTSDGPNELECPPPGSEYRHSGNIEASLVATRSRCARPFKERPAVLLDRLATLTGAREQNGRHELIASRRFLTPAWRRVDLRADHSSKV
jgi:hypothetical protein